MKYDFITALDTSIKFFSTNETTHTSFHELVEDLNSAYTVKLFEKINEKGVFSTGKYIPNNDDLVFFQSVIEKLLKEEYIKQFGAYDYILTIDGMAFLTSADSSILRSQPFKYQRAKDNKLKLWNKVVTCAAVVEALIIIYLTWLQTKS